MYHAQSAMATTGTSPPTIPPTTSTRWLLNNSANRGPTCPPITQPIGPLIKQLIKASIGVPISNEAFFPMIAGAMPMANRPPMAPTTAPAAAPKLTSPIRGPFIGNAPWPSGNKLQQFGNRSSFFDWYKCPRGGAGVIGSRPDEAVVRALLHDMGRPACGAGDHEQWREHRRRDPAKVECG